MTEKKDLFQQIREYGIHAVPMHMPGHKRNIKLLGTDLPYCADITEIHGFDDLHDMEDGGVLRQIADRAAKLYGAKRAFPLVSGSTGGILSAIRALTQPNDKALIARNCHKSVYHAVELCGLRHVSLLPQIDESTGIYGSILPLDVASAFEAHPEIRTVVITSPTYEGAISDTNVIADIVHQHGATLIVDAAHGSHLPFFENLSTFPTNSDIVITSLHKTLPALTQTALALVYAKEPHISERLAREITVFETSSPSYILLSSIERCIALLEGHAPALFEAYKKRLDRFYIAAASLSSLKLLTADSSAFFGFDRGKLVIFSKSESGTVLANRLRHEFGIEPEMAYTDYVLCMTSVCDSDESFERLLSALHEIDRTASTISLDPPRKPQAVVWQIPEQMTSIAKAIHLPITPLKAGDLSTLYAWVYPPGVPLIVPGERVTEESLHLIEALKSSGLSVRIGR